MKLSSTKKILLFLTIISTILIAANYFFFISIKNINLNESVLSNDVDRYKKLQEKTGQNSIDNLRTLLDKINSYFVGKEGVVSFIENIEKEAKDTGITLFIRSVDTEPYGATEKNPKGDLTKEYMRLKIEATGSWINNIRFVYFLEHLPYKLQLENVSFSKIIFDENISSGETGTVKIKGSTSTLPLWRTKIELIVLKQK